MADSSTNNGIIYTSLLKVHEDGGMVLITSDLGGYAIRALTTHFDPGASPEDVDAFLRRQGWHRYGTTAEKVNGWLIFKIQRD